MLPLAPGLLSTRIGWPSAAASFSPSARAARSVEPPGGNATTMRTGFDGQDCAQASCALNAIPAAVKKIFSMLMFMSSYLQCKGLHLGFVDLDAEPWPAGHQRKSAVHRVRRLQVILRDVLRPVQVDRIVDAIGGKEMHGSRKPDRRIHETAADQSEPGVAREVAELARIVDSAGLVGLDHDRLDRLAANQFDDHRQSRGRLVQRDSHARSG